jgi:hypothetical protein
MIMMEKKVNATIQSHILAMKENLKEKIQKYGSEHNCDMSCIIQYMFDYPPLIIKNEDIVRKKRSKTAINPKIRCCAKRANGEQCTRKKRENSKFCGTHEKVCPYGEVNISQMKEEASEHITEEIETVNEKGIIHFTTPSGLTLEVNEWTCQV